ncbi:Na(+)/H(+) antiporter subunit D [Pseudohalocynthiibacter aestuariivivens]|jgi:multicomponent Na+:H+ antiporter subunit D|uniref:Na(+)/H(+) antiporter subunit D n=1 Tax=Pseudohalocynthiibacter aestuariivivens TaxID=1591409 RepID=A0ABV5JJA1_9RHOB|nr:MULTISPECIES: Na(+)/H(+) antiporter subunit D [Pseudohalocynthiibacter]MBS9718477.1 Na(+)/H(+) antiporter subunit D [Pseudohalocynthiibacter aestuariivivens]MCK0104054.1 Na(+)/H(+) antiporter subunit D [Pseudohalocynthiibacter sp. F2068]
MAETFPIAFLFFAGAAGLLALPKGHARAALLLAVPVVACLFVWSLPEGNLWTVRFFNLDLEFMRVDRLSRIFALIFTIAAFLGNLYAWHVRDTVQQLAALLYAGSAIGAVFAGDLITLFFYWEGTAITSVFLIWARRTEGAYHTGVRYLIVQVGSGVLLLAGAALFYRESGSIAFDKMTLGSIGTWLIFLAFGIKCAFPLLHNWLQDAYPAATVTGTVVLSAFTTKLAVYALARGFPGTEMLIYIGAVMTLFPIFFAVIENDLRRVLAYSLNNQLGFMVVGIGIGTELSLNGTAAHAFAHILYKALLFMSVGAVLFRTGTAKGSELGGLYKTMPLTMIFCVIGAASISAFPLFSGFISKSLILSAASHDGYYIVWAILLFASAGVFHHSGIKIPYFAFFAHDSGLRPKEAPLHMLLAMGLTAFLCVAIGVFPGPLYALLPFDVDYVPYTTTHVVTQLQLLFFSALAFTVLMRTGIYPPELKSVNLDTDWTYRRLMPVLIGSVSGVLSKVWAAQSNFTQTRIRAVIARLYHSHGPEGRMAQSWPTGSMVIWIAVLLGFTLIVNFLS